LEIYRRVWRLNRALGPDRRIRIIAADLPDWPPVRPVSPHAAVRLYAERDAYMADRLEREVFARHPHARVLVFMGGYHGIKSGGATLHYGGGPPVNVTWLATRLRERRLRSEEHTSELQSRENLVCRLLLEKKKHKTKKR